MAAQATASENMKVGFVGIGIMGLAMANNLIAAGYDVTVWNRNKDKCIALQEKGAKVADSAKAVAEQCDITVAMLADPQAAEAVATGPDGIAAGMGSGKGYVDVSTVDAGTAQNISKAIKNTGALYLEAPVSGSKAPAEKGELIFLCGGDKELYEQATPLLQVMGKAQFLLGEVGKGANMKLVVNMMMGTMMTTLAEGLTLAQKADLDQKQLVEVLGLGVMNCPLFAMKVPPMQEHKYPTAFPLKHQQKDMRLALELAHQRGQQLPTVSAANSLYEQAKDMGQADADFSAVLEAVIKQTT
ncbi:hypothetical protein ABBQ32_003540 [Trebouxia sp. C0010 RCD-2024]